METSVPDKTEEARESESKLVKQISESSGSFGKLLTLVEFILLYLVWNMLPE